MDQTITAPTKSAFSFNSLAYWAILILTALLPIFVIPGWTQSIDVSKRFLVAIAALVGLVGWFASRLQQGKISFPGINLLIPMFAVVVVTTLSALLHTPRFLGLIGNEMALGTAWSLFLGFVLMFVGAVYINSLKRQQTWYLTLGGGLIAAVIAQLLVFAISSLRPGGGLLPGPTLFGSWSDLGASLTLLVIIVAGAFEFLGDSLTKRVKTFLWPAAGLALVLLVFLGQPIWWWILGVIALVIFFVRFHHESAATPRLWRPATVLVAIAALYLLSFYVIPTLRSSVAQVMEKQGISITEVRPAFRPSLATLHQTLRAEPLLGAGPLQFDRVWHAYGFAPEINRTIFWDISFNYGHSLALSLLTMTGLLGVFAWALFFSFFIIQGVRIYRTPDPSRQDNHFSQFNWIIAGYLWLVLWLTPSSSVSFYLAFLLTGVMIGSLVLEKRSPIFGWSLVRGKQTGTLALSSLIFCIIISLALLVVGLRAALAHNYLERAYDQLGQGAALEAIEPTLISALNLGLGDAAARLLVDLRTSQLSRLLQDNPGDEAAQAKARLLVEGAIAAGRVATQYNPHYYGNWLSLGGVYEQLALAQVPGAPAEGRLIYSEAAKRHPNSPLPPLGQARLDLAEGKTASAREKLRQAISLKPNFLLAWGLLLDLAEQNGTLSTLINDFAQVAAAFPDEPQMWMQLGYRYYQTSSYRSAIEALNRAIVLVPSFSDARYFLGLSYEAVGETAKAREQFLKVLELNPDNQVVKERLGMTN